MNTGKIILNKGREKSVLGGHPWIFSGAVKELSGVTRNGQPVRVMSSAGQFLGMASVSMQSQIRARMWTSDDRAIDGTFILERMRTAMRRREALAVPGGTDAYRLVNAEADGMPGLIVDLYGDVAVCQFLSAGAEFFREEVVQALETVARPAAVHERSDTDARTKEGLEKKTGLLAGSPGRVEVVITESGVKYAVNVVDGHKTGFYLDQRENRKVLSDMASDAEVLNCFSYTGGFGLSALSGGARTVTNIDTSAPALEMAAKNALLNGFDPTKMNNITGDVFRELRLFRDRGQDFGIVVLDPPKFAESASQVPGAARGYKDINMLGMKLVRRGGLLFTFSCSGHMTPELFRKVVADAAVDAGRQVQVIRVLQQAGDHPVMLNFPEGLYLKGFVCRVW